MSVHYSSAVWKSRIGDPVAKHVLLKLADNASDEGKCWPSIATISAETELSQRTIQTKVRFLEGLGVLVSYRGVNRCNYQLRMEAIKDLGRVQEMQGAGDAGCISRHPTPQEMHPTPQDVQLHKGNHQRTVKEPSGVSLPFSSLTFLETWNLWLDHRKALKKPSTPQSQKMALNKICKMTEDEAIAAIRHSVENNWQSIYPPKPTASTIRPTNEQFSYQKNGLKLRPFD